MKIFYVIFVISIAHVCVQADGNGDNYKIPDNYYSEFDNEADAQGENSFNSEEDLNSENIDKEYYENEDNLDSSENDVYTSSATNDDDNESENEINSVENDPNLSDTRPNEEIISADGENNNENEETLNENDNLNENEETSSENEETLNENEENLNENGENFNENVGNFKQEEENVNENEENINENKEIFNENKENFNENEQNININEENINQNDNFNEIEESPTEEHSSQEETMNDDENQMSSNLQDTESSSNTHENTNSGEESNIISDPSVDHFSDDDITSRVHPKLISAHFIGHLTERENITVSEESTESNTFENGGSFQNQEKLEYESANMTDKENKGNDELININLLNMLILKKENDVTTEVQPESTITPETDDLENNQNILDSSPDSEDIQDKSEAVNASDAVSSLQKPETFNELVTLEKFDDVSSFSLSFNGWNFWGQWTHINMNKFMESLITDKHKLPDFKKFVLQSKKSKYPSWMEKKFNGLNNGVLRIQHYSYFEEDIQIIGSIKIDDNEEQLFVLSRENGVEHNKWIESTFEIPDYSGDIIISIRPLLKGIDDMWAITEIEISGYHAENDKGTHDGETQGEENKEEDSKDIFETVTTGEITDQPESDTAESATEFTEKSHQFSTELPSTNVYMDNATTEEYVMNSVTTEQYASTSGMESNGTEVYVDYFNVTTESINNSVTQESTDSEYTTESITNISVLPESSSNNYLPVEDSEECEGGECTTLHYTHKVYKDVHSIATGIWDAFYLFIALFCFCLISLIVLIIRNKKKRSEYGKASGSNYKNRKSSYQLAKAQDNPAYQTESV